MTQTFKVILIVCVQVFIIAIVIVSRYSILAGGADILLRIQPVDPRDPLRGDYVTYRFDISETYNYDSELHNGDSVYVPLRKSGKFWGISGSVVRERPDQSSDEVVYLRGVVISGGKQDFERSPLAGDISGVAPLGWRGGGGGGYLRIEYGIEQYFIEEGKGRTFNFGGHEAYARVSVTPDGRSALRQIYIDDKPWP